VRLLLLKEKKNNKHQIKTKGKEKKEGNKIKK
jgi:hypothetical protein